MLRLIAEIRAEH